MRGFILAAFAAFLVGCTATGPQKALDDLAQAMDKNNGQAFLAGIDMDAYAANYVSNMTNNDEALSSINAIGQMFGLGNLDDLIGSIVDMRKRLSDQFNREIATGELMAKCRQADTPNCPWVPQSLRDARIVEIGQDAAIAQVTTPARLTSWLALRKIDGKWLVVGQAAMESTAREYAAASKPQQSPGNGGASL